MQCTTTKCLNNLPYKAFSLLICDVFFVQLIPAVVSSSFIELPFSFKNTDTFGCFGIPNSNSSMKTRADENIVIAV